MLILLGFAFLSGLVTILAPCIWPLLPIVLSSVAGKGRARPLGITVGVMLSFTVFTLALSSFVQIFHFDPNIFRLIAVFILALLGIIMIFPAFSAILESGIAQISNRFGAHNQVTKTGFGPGFIVGLSLGVVWAPCAGPILAAIATLAALGRVSFSVVAVTVAYVFGVGIPLLIFAYGGQKLFASSHFVSRFTGLIQQIFGIILIFSAIAIYTNYDKIIEISLLNRFPWLAQSVSQFENTAVVEQQLDILKGQVSSTPNVNISLPFMPGLFNTNRAAPEIISTGNWLNSEPLTLRKLKGKVILVDFWTYTCINCIRTLPHVTSWYEKYKDQGFVVLGVHTPEFEFEKNPQNVKKAITQFNINYPVVQDNDYRIWNAFSNRYWPAEYLIDANGIIRREHFGEGEYDETELAIQTLLAENGHGVTTTLSIVPDQTPTEFNLSPETYLGSARAEFYYPFGSIENGTKKFVLDSQPPIHSVSLGGEWTITTAEAIAGRAAVLNYHFSANKVFLVLRPGKVTSTSIKVFLDGKLVGTSNAGSDVVQGEVKVNTDRLYNLIDLDGKSGSHLLRLEFEPGTEAFAFTFG